MLNRTVCDIHVFDPTVKQSDMRHRETVLNELYGRKRITWHSWGILHAHDEDYEYCSVPLLCLLQLRLSTPAHKCLSNIARLPAIKPSCSAP
jgi:hypothetical protein